MLPKRNRIERKSFQFILDNGKRYNSSSLSLCVAPIDKEKAKEARFSFSVSKKVCQKSTNRNKHRRWGYSIVSKKLKYIKPGFYYFFKIKKLIKPNSFNNTEKGVTELLSLSDMLR